MSAPNWAKSTASTAPVTVTEVRVPGTAAASAPNQVQNAPVAPTVGTVRDTSAVSGESTPSETVVTLAGTVSALMPVRPSNSAESNAVTPSRTTSAPGYLTGMNSSSVPAAL